MSLLLLRVGANDNLIELTLTDPDTQAAINDATVTVTVKTLGVGVDVVGVAWPLAVPYVAASEGVYSVTFPGSVFVVNNKYKVHTHAVAPGAKELTYDDLALAVNFAS